MLFPVSGIEVNPLIPFFVALTISFFTSMGGVSGVWIRLHSPMTANRMGFPRQVTQIGKECHARCAIFHQVGDCVMPREGIFVRVLKGGEIKPGDAIRVLEG